MRIEVNDGRGWTCGAEQATHRIGRDPRAIKVSSGDVTRHAGRKVSDDHAPWVSRCVGAARWDGSGNRGMGVDLD